MTFNGGLQDQKDWEEGGGGGLRFDSL